MLMDDLTPWVYWGVGPDQAWSEALETKLIEVAGYFREALEGDVAATDGRVGAGETSGAGSVDEVDGRWVEMTEEEYRGVVAEYTRRREAFQGSDEHAEIIKVWALGRFLTLGWADHSPRGSAGEFVVNARSELSEREVDVADGVQGTMEGQEGAADGGGDHDRVEVIGKGPGQVEEDRQNEEGDSVAVCVVGREEELDSLIISLRSVMAVLPTWRVKIYSPPSMTQAVRRRLLPVVALSRGYHRVEFAELEEFSDESFARNASTDVLWGTHHVSDAGRVLLVFDGGVHYDTLFKTRRFWESIPAEHVLIFQVSVRRSARQRCCGGGGRR